MNKVYTIDEIRAMSPHEVKNLPASSFGDLPANGSTEKSTWTICKQHYSESTWESLVQKYKIDMFGDQVDE